MPMGRLVGTTGDKQPQAARCDTRADVRRPRRTGGSAAPLPAAAPPLTGPPLFCFLLASTAWIVPCLRLRGTAAGAGAAACSVACCCCWLSALPPRPRRAERRAGSASASACSSCSSTAAGGCSATGAPFCASAARSAGAASCSSAGASFLLAGAAISFLRSAARQERRGMRVGSKALCGLRSSSPCGCPSALHTLPAQVGLLLLAHHFSRNDHQVPRHD